MTNLELARLVGAYHARKGWGDPAIMTSWRNSLTPQERIAYLDYRMYGMMMFDRGASIVIPPSVPSGLIGAFAGLSKQFQELGEAIADVLGKSVTPAFADISAVIERIERDRLYSRLRSAHMPDQLARWITARYPLDWTLDNPRLRDFLDRFLRRGHHEA